MSKGERNLVFGDMFARVFAGGVQMLKWLPSSAKGEIVDIMANVLSLMETYLIQM